MRFGGTKNGATRGVDGNAPLSEDMRNYALHLLTTQELSQRELSSLVSDHRFCVQTGSVAVAIMGAGEAVVVAAVQRTVVGTIGVVVSARVIIRNASVIGVTFLAILSGCPIFTNTCLVCGIAVDGRPGAASASARPLVSKDTGSEDKAHKQ